MAETPLKPVFEPEPDPPREQPGPLLAWLRLMRLPNVFTALSDVAMGFAFTRVWTNPLDSFELSDGLLLACLACASALLYTAGMVLNDVYDVDIDARERPNRPLPSGQIEWPAARAIGYTMLIMGVALAWVAGLVYGRPIEGAIYWRGGVVAVLLAGSVVLYDAWLKRTPLGPLGMGTCRFLNVLLGMSVAASSSASIVLGYGAAELLAAAGIGVYVVGITWFARNEAGQSSRSQLAGGLAVMAAGIVLLGVSLTQRGGLWLPREYYWVLLGLVLLTIVRRGVVAATDPTPGRVQGTVKLSILSLIVFDAAVCMAVAPPLYALAVVVLLLPAFVLGRWVYST